MPWLGTERRRERSLLDKLREALRGIKLGMRGRSSFAVHFFVAAIVLMAAVVLECSWLEWCLLIGCIGLVFTAELFKSAIELLFQSMHSDEGMRRLPVMDIASGAVLMTCWTSSIVGSIVLVRKTLYLLQIM